MRLALSVFVTLATLSSSANAETNARIETTVTPHCEAHTRDLERRLSDALGESSSRRFDVSVAIERDSAGYRVALVVLDESSAPREKILLAPTCEEAADAAVVVLALATSEAARESSEPSAPTPPTVAVGRVVDAEPASLPSGSPGPQPHLRANARPPKDEGVQRVESASPRGAASRVSLSTGIDAGTLPSPTLVVSGGFARSFSALEVRGLARYGLPIVEETTETGYSESVRRDFGALELRACYGIGADVRLSACAGGELGAVRISRRVAENGIDVDEDGVTPRLSGVLSALLRHQGGVVEPELEVSGSALAAGGQEAASRVALRVSAGAAVEF